MKKGKADRDAVELRQQAAEDGVRAPPVPLQVLYGHFHRLRRLLLVDGKRDNERALENYMKAVPVAEEATGKLSKTTGMLCHSIGLVYENQQRWAEAVPWYEKAVAAFTFTYGAENEQYTKRAVRDLEEAKRKAAQQQQQ